MKKKTMSAYAAHAKKIAISYYCVLRARKVDYANVIFLLS